MTWGDSVVKGAHLYIRVSADLEQKIRSGEFDGVGQIPSENALTQEYGVARMTIRHAVDRLIAEGLLVRRHGSGTYLTGESSLSRSLNQLGGYKEEIETEDVTVETRMVVLAAQKPPADIAEHLGLSAHNVAVRVKRVRGVNGKPTAVQDSWLPYALCPTLPNEELLEGSLYATLAQRHGVRIGWADQSITAVGADSELAQLLEVAVGSPLLQMERLTFDQGNSVVEFARSWMRPGYRATVRLERG